MINEFKYRQNWKIWPSPLSLSLYSTINSRLYGRNWFSSRPYQTLGLFLDLAWQNGELHYELKFESDESGPVRLDEPVHFTGPHQFTLVNAQKMKLSIKDYFNIKQYQY